MDHLLKRAPSLLRAAAWGLLWVGLAAALAVATTWPAALTLSGHAVVPLTHADLQAGLWWGPALARSLAEGSSIFWRPELIWPDGQDTRFLLWNFLAQLVMAPLYLSFSPLTATNLAALLCMVLNGLAGAWAGRVVTSSRLGALAGLVAGATCAFSFTEGAGGRLDQALWAPAAVFMGGLVLLWRTPGRWGPRLICGAGLGLSGAVYWFYGYFLVLLLVLLAAGALVTRKLPRQRIVDLALVGLVAALVALPFLAPLLSRLADGGEMIRVATSEHPDAVLQQAPFGVPLLWGNLGGLVGAFQHQGTRTPLLLLPVCLLVAWRARGAVRWVALMGLLAVVFAAGPLLTDTRHQPLAVGQNLIWGPMALLDLLPGFARLWWPYRWQAVALAALALAVPWLLHQARWRRLWLTLFILWSLVDNAMLIRAEPRLQFMRPVAVPPLLEVLGRGAGQRPIVELPFDRGHQSTMGFASWHRQPIDAGLGPWLHRHPGRQQRRKSILLWRVLDRAVKGQTSAAPQRWTEAQAGGFHYVFLYNHHFAAGEYTRVLQRVSAVMGRPLTSSPNFAAWYVRGVGQPPFTHGQRPQRR